MCRSNSPHMRKETDAPVDRKSQFVVFPQTVKNTSRKDHYRLNAGGGICPSRLHRNYLDDNDTQKQVDYVSN